MGKIFLNDNQLEEWVAAADGIREQFGLYKALGYVIGEKFYNLVKILYSSRQSIRSIDEKRKKPDYKPVIEKDLGNSKITINWDEEYEHEKAVAAEAEQLLPKFAGLIKDAFAPDEIKEYFKSNPRFGALGHISSDEEFDFFVEHGAVEHSLDTEINDALIFGDIMKYFGVL
ncbi:MAG: hypothetical protein M0033_03810 [Nitrospiraceae bacterium]|nr:hypothetical protein [Nitrospiraceae bacterium]